MEKYERITNSEQDYYEYNGSPADVYRKLVGLEDKIENGTLIELPCKIGDTVWRWVIRDCYDEWVVDKICLYIENSRVDYTLVCSSKTCGIEYFYKDDKDIEWTFNKPKAEAEKRLKELQNERQSTQGKE